MSRIYLTLYYLIFSKLPDYAYPGGRIFNRIRISLLKKVIPIGKNCRIQSRVYVGNGNNISVGDNCRINDNVKLDNVEIGNFVMIARNTQILGKMHKFKRLDIPMLEQKGEQQQKTIIEDDVWIGLNCVIMPGLRIRKGCIIGAGAVLTRDTIEYGIYGGVPAKLIKKR